MKSILDEFKGLSNQVEWAQIKRRQISSKGSVGYRLFLLRGHLRSLKDPLPRRLIGLNCWEAILVAACWTLRAGSPEEKIFRHSLLVRHLATTDANRIAILSGTLAPFVTGQAVTLSNETMAKMPHCPMHADLFENSVVLGLWVIMTTGSSVQKFPHHMMVLGNRVVGQDLSLRECWGLGQSGWSWFLSQPSLKVQVGGRVSQMTLAAYLAEAFRTCRASFGARIQDCSYQLVAYNFSQKKIEEFCSELSAFEVAAFAKVSSAAPGSAEFSKWVHDSRAGREKEAIATRYANLQQSKKILAGKTAVGDSADFMEAAEELRRRRHATVSAMQSMPPAESARRAELAKLYLQK